MKKPAVLSIVIFFLFMVQLHAQQFGGTPAGIRWKQIQTDTARIIYPEGQDSVAQRIAALVHYQQRKFSHTLGNSVHTINIVLRNELTYFNGYVALGPYRSEYYLLPPQNAFDLGAQSVTDLLSIHEYRHVEQYNNFRKGLSKAAYVVFGQNGQALANDAAIPDWFFEGDAVYNETMLSQQGRGRLPDFFNGYKSLYFAGKHYPYMKLRNGSYKDFVPNQYPLGYMLVAYGREKYGDDFWKNVTDGTARFKPLIYPLQGNIKKFAGIPYKQFVSDAFAYYQQQWALQKTETISWITSEEKHNVVDYRYPYKMDNNDMIVLKRSYQKLPAFYAVDSSGNEEKIALQSITNDDYFSYNNGTIAYAAYQPDVRWGYREYSVIKLLDVASRKEKRITSRSKYFSPDISHDGRLVAAVSVTPHQQATVDVMQTNGTVVATLLNNENNLYAYPKFAADDQSLYVMVRKTTGEMSLQQWDFTANTTTVLLPFANRILGYPVVQGDTILYSCSNKGNDEIWAYVASQKKHFRAANYQTGLYQAIISGNKVIASAFTASGYRLGGFHPQWQADNVSADTLVDLYVKKPFQTAANNTLATVPDNVGYATSRYSKWSHPFNFHSLQPDYSDPIFSLSLYGENILSTIKNEIYYNYNDNERYSQVGYRVTYGASYVQPFVDVSEIFGRKAFDNRNDNVYTYNEFNGLAGLQLPLNFSGNKQSRFLTALVAYGVNNTQFTGDTKSVADNFTNGYVQGQVSYLGQKQQAFQYIYPHWAQSILVQYKKLTDRNSAGQFFTRGSLYLPGVLASHSIVLDGAYRRQTFQRSQNFFNYTFSDNFPYARDYASYNFPTVYKAGINYHLPLMYPDFGIGNMVYLRRLRANFFFDFTSVSGTVNNVYYKADLKSTGAELYLDTKWWNQQNITFGLRYSRLLDNKTVGMQPNQWTLILPSSIFE